MSMMEPGRLSSMAEAVCAEIGTADCLAGLGFMLHGDRLHAPLALRALTPLMVQDRMEEFSALKEAVSAKSVGNALLHRYAGDWWPEFSVDAAPYPQKVADVIQFWRTQYPTLPIPTIFPPLEALNVNALTGIELWEAHAVGQDLVTMLQRDIQRCLEHTQSLAMSIKGIEGMRNELRAREEKELKVVAAREIGRAMNAGASGS